MNFNGNILARFFYSYLLSYFKTSNLLFTGLFDTQQGPTKFSSI